MVSLSRSFVSSGLFISSTSSLEVKAEWGIIIIRSDSQDYGYEFYFNQYSKLHYAKSEFLMWPNKCLLMPWDPSDVQSKAPGARPVQFIGVVDLQIPWNPGIVTIHNAFVLYVKAELQVGARRCGGYAPLLEGKQCFLRVVLSMPGTLGDVGWDVMGHRLVVMRWRYRFMATKGEATTGEGIKLV